MFLTMLKAKLHRATVTSADLDYEGSVGIDLDLMKISGILPNERVEIYDITNGARLATYAIPLPRGSRAIQINGATARLVNEGDRVIICAYAQMDYGEAREHSPRVVLLDEDNQVKEVVAFRSED